MPAAAHDSDAPEEPGRLRDSRTPPAYAASTAAAGGTQPTSRGSIAARRPIHQRRPTPTGSSGPVHRGDPGPGAQSSNSSQPCDQRTASSTAIATPATTTADSSHRSRPHDATPTDDPGGTSRVRGTGRVNARRATAALPANEM